MIVMLSVAELEVENVSLSVLNFQNRVIGDENCLNITSGIAFIS